MGSIEDYRKQINDIDEEMARLFEQRMQVCRSIAEYKKEKALPIKDATRETELTKKSRSFISDREVEPYYISFLKNNIELSCAYQSRIINGMRVAYSGVPGAYAHIAAKRMFPGAELINFTNFEPAYRAAENGDVDCAVLPLENSYAGEVGAVMDLAFSGSLFINRVVGLEIEHNLLANEGAGVDKIKTVVSHPQALQQCDEYIKRHGFETLEYSNTARAAEFVKESGRADVAAIASEDTAELFGLKILEKNINTAKNNTSRFGVFSRSMSVPNADAKDDQCSFLLVFTVPHKAGALAMMLDIIGAHGYNIDNLKSRPMKGLIWQYYFYLEIEGNINRQEGQDMLHELGAISDRLKLVGAYSSDVVI